MLKILRVNVRRYCSFNQLFLFCAFDLISVFGYGEKTEVIEIRILKHLIIRLKDWVHMNK